MTQRVAVKSVKTSTLRVRTLILISLLIIVGTCIPVTTRAGLFSAIMASIKGNGGGAASTAQAGNLQTMTLLRPAMNISPAPALGGAEVTIEDFALVPQEGPSGTRADIEKPKNTKIELYVVREGNTISEIAEMFGVSVNTIRWANDIPVRDTIRPGQQLIILPVTGVKYVVKKGDTLASIAKRYEGDAQEIASFNGLEDEASLAVGSEIIIPDGAPVLAPTSSVARSSSPAVSSNASISAGYYLRPLQGGVRSQGIHGYNGVDIAAPVGTPIVASADGDVIVARNSGWNGGYGSYVVIRHGNESQTLYAHASSVVVSVGQYVGKGQVVGYVGETGRATGPHVHFEIRNGPRNPF